MAKKSRPRVSAAVRRARERAAQSPAKVASSLRLYVQVEPKEPVVTAFVVTPKQRELAVRTWALSSTGIRVECDCPKGAACPANNVLLKPQPVQGIDAQLEAEIAQLRQEYGIAANHVSYLSLIRGLPTPMPRLILSGLWKDPLALSQSLAGWEAEYDLQHSRYALPPPAWLASLPELKADEKAQAERVVKITYGLLTFEGVLKADELFGRVLELARPGAWCDRRTFEALLRQNAERFKALASGWIATTDVRSVVAMAKRKASCPCPPRAFSAEELLAASERPLSEQEIQLEREFRRAGGVPMGIRLLQRMARNAASMSEFVSEVAKFLWRPEKDVLKRMGAALADIWDHTPRYELGGRTPAEG